MRRTLALGCGTLGLLTLFATNGLKAQAPKAPSNTAADLTGTYQGTWTMYGIDAAGSPQKRASWSDVLVASAPVTEAGRSFVTTADTMTFDGGRIPPMTIKGREGYLDGPAGSRGQYFIEMNGGTTQPTELSKGVWVFSSVASPQELTQMGFPNPISGRHTTVKIVTTEAGLEVHHITRVSTVNWKDAEGKDRWIQFVSLEGTHRHVTNDVTK